MNQKVQEKEEAIRLRKRGHSYKDILEELSVAKSTLSNWLKDLPLTDEEKQYLKKRKNNNIGRGRIKAAASHRRSRLERERVLFGEAKEEFNKFICDPLFHTGIALYWAEGAKRNSFFAFSNSDPAMMEIMIYWIKKFFGTKKSDIDARLYIHKLYAHENCEQFWSGKIDIPLSNFKKTVYKPTGLLIKKRPNYKGCLRISLRCSMNYLRKMIFWQNMLVEHYKKQ